MIKKAHENVILKNKYITKDDYQKASYDTDDYLKAYYNVVKNAFLMKDVCQQANSELLTNTTDFISAAVSVLFCIISITICIRQKTLCLIKKDFTAFL